MKAWELIRERSGGAGYLPLLTRTYVLPDGTAADWDIYGCERSVAILALTPNDDVVLAPMAPGGAALGG